MKKLLGIVVLGLLWCNISCAEKVNIYDFEFPDRKPYEFQLFKKLISFKPNTYGYNNEEILKRAIKNIPFLCRSGSYSGYASLHDTSVLEGIEEILNNPNKPLHEFNFRFPKNCKNSRTPNGVRLMPFIKSKKYIFSKTYLSAVWVNRKKFLNANVPTNRGMEGFPHYDIFLYRFLNIPIDEKTKEKLLKVSNNTGVVNREAFANIIKVLDDSKKTQTAKKEPSQMQGVATNNEEIYFACLNVMVKDRSTIDNFQPGEEYGFQYFKLDSNNSEITVHEQIYDDKPEKIGSIKIDYQGKKTVEFDIRRKEGTTIISDKFKLSSKGRFYKDDGYDNYSFEATTYVKTKSDVMDYDFKSKMCLPPKDDPPKDKKIYKKWIKSGYY